MASKPFMGRFFKKFGADVCKFVMSQQILTVAFSAIIAALYQYEAGRLTFQTLRENVATVIFPFIWIICVCGCYFAVRSAIEVHREMVTEANTYMSAIPGYRPKPPKPVHAMSVVSVIVAALGVISYGTFTAAFPKGGRVTRQDSFVFLQPLYWDSKRTWNFQVVSRGPDNLYNIQFEVGDVSAAPFNPKAPKSNVSTFTVPEMDATGNSALPKFFAWTPGNIDHEEYIDQPLGTDFCWSTSGSNVSATDGLTTSS